MQSLIVDSSAERVSAITKLLAENGCVTELRTTAQAALSYLAQRPTVDLIVLDTSDMNSAGAEVLRRLQAGERLRRLPVVAANCLARVAGSKQPRDLRESTLLVVDDELVLLRLLGRVLERDGYRVTTARSAKDALREFESGKVGFVVSDIDMPEMTGLDLLEEIRRSDPDIPMLMMTGNGSRYDHATVMAAGADGYIPKPFKNADLMTLIDLMSGEGLTAGFSSTTGATAV
ncbi:response regulator [candidate division GN15 bacterium]|nr:response regulator [candidate division GN15 bacterium]